MKPQYQSFVNELSLSLDHDQIQTDPLKTLAFGTDASFYRLIPQVVVTLKTEDQVALLLKLAEKHAVHLTFRAAGTSLSGQAVTDGVLVRLAPNWNGMKVMDAGERLWVQPGVIGAQANRKLAPFHRKIGPDPASINSCKIGGIVANNASGMCCGTAQNTYQTLDSMRLILADGTLLDTSDPKSRSDLMDSHPQLLAELAAIRDEVAADSTLRDRIERKFSIKNTTGYSLNALIDYQDPIDILMHLMVGSEGTLGFVSSVVYRTVEEHQHKASALLLFNDIETTSRAVTALSRSPVAAVELMDTAGLRSVQGKPGMPEYLSGIADGVSALLVEIRATSHEELSDKQQQVEAELNVFETLQPKVFTTDPETCQTYWKIRKGLFPAVGAVREKGTTVIIEDVAFPIESLAPAVLELQGLFKKYHYDEAVIFGHALAGNLHFVFTQDFGNPEEVRRYADFMDEVCVLVVGQYDGSLKAEHGTGRNMAPFVEMEWGAQAYELMKRIKAAFDPKGMLNPDVILSSNLRVHIDNLKPIPEADDLVDPCIECGFCEPVCPSKNLTLTPRQRIVVMRELARQEREGFNANYETLLKDYQYQGIDTCAADGLCSLACPVGINTGDLSRKLRGERNATYAETANRIGRHFGSVENTARIGLKLVDTTRSLLGDGALEATSKVLSKASFGKLPQWHSAMPTCAVNPDIEKLSEQSMQEADGASQVLYFPSCASRVMGPDKGDKDQRSLQQVTLDLSRKAGIHLIRMPEQSNYCCGMPMESKGLFESADGMSQTLNPRYPT